MKAQGQFGTKQVFLLALLAAAVMFLPFVLMDGGYFLYYGDFNVQQIPFYQLAHEAVRSGDIFWNWNTDLGANFIGSYSFYLLFSPFFWLTLPFPNAWVPFLMAPLLALKTACAATTAFWYLRRFVKNTQYAAIGAMLYAFSGWMDFNIFFNHFHEVAVFFPLLLLGLEMLLVDGKKGPFAVAVAVNACVNYWFFVGEAVFVVLYVFIRMTDKSWRPNLKKFGFIALEAVLGVICSAAVMLPSVLAIMGNPRTGTEELLNGWGLWLYWHEQRQPAILQSLLFPPESPARPNFFPDHGAKWASLSGWLPLFSVTGVLAYFFRRQNDWVKKILALSLLFALIPALNSTFILFNDSYYARWFYMPILLMALATARALEESGPEYGANALDDFARAIKWAVILVAAYTLICGTTPVVDENGSVSFGLADDPTVMWAYAAIAMICLAVTAALLLLLRGHKHFPAITLAAVLVVSAGFNFYYIGNGKNSPERCDWIIEHALHGEEKITLPDDKFARVDIYDGQDNLAMYWGLPTIQAFHSIVPPSIMEFYPEIGVARDVASRPETENYALRPLLSVRWLFIEEDKEEQEPMPGYRYVDTMNDFNLYENENYLPMGFSYDLTVTPEQLEEYAIEKRSNLMLRAVVLEEDAQQRLAHLVTPLPEDNLTPLNEETMAEDVEQRRIYTADSFETDTRGFTATTSFDESRLLFFSVPWDAGWSAKLMTEDGKTPLTIEKANIGFMAVEVPAGEVTIRFDYTTPGLKTGIMISLSGLVLLVGYFWLTRASRKSQPPIPESSAADGAVTLTVEQFQAQYGDAQARREKMRCTLEKAAVLYKQCHGNDPNASGKDKEIPADSNETQH